MNPEQPTEKKQRKPSKPLTEEQKARARARWHEKKEQYRASKKKPEGTPTTLQVGELPPLPKKDKKTANYLLKWKIPDDIRSIFNGDADIELPTNQATWPMFHVRRQEELSKVTKDIYKSYYSKLPRTDIWNVIRYISKFPLAQQNQYAKAGLSYVSEELYNDLYKNKEIPGPASKEYSDRILRMMVFSRLNQITKKQVYERHVSQIASEERIENTVKWEEWDMVAKRFVRTLMTKKEPTAKDRKDALVVALYSYLPPIRLDWNDVEVRVTQGGKTFEKNQGEKGKNILYLSSTKSDSTIPKEATVFWGEFKNASAFELPLKQSIPKDLIKVIKFAAPTSQFTPGQTYDLLRIPHFSDYLSSLAEQLTGKHFTNRLMRSSFIRHFHQQHSAGEMDVNKTKEMMKQIHQSNMEVHLAYVKNKTMNLTDETDT